MSYQPTARLKLVPARKVHTFKCNLVEVATAMIWFFSAVKPDDPSVRKGKMSRRTGFFLVHEFRSASLGRARAQDRRLRELYHVECGTRIPVGVPEARTPASTSPGRLRGTRLPVTTV